MSAILFHPSERLSLLELHASPEELVIVRRLSPEFRKELEVALEEDRRAGLLAGFQNEKAAS